MPKRFTPSKGSQQPLFRRLGGPRVQGGRVRWNSPRPRLEPRTSQHVVTPYTDWVTTATMQFSIWINKILDNLRWEVEMLLMRPRIPKFWEIKMKVIITVSTHTEPNKSSPSQHPTAQVPILYYFPPSVCVFPSCFLSWRFTIKHFSGLHIFRFCHLCYIIYSVSNYIASVPEEFNLWRS
jgi:hypothetical protein